MLLQSQTTYLLTIMTFGIPSLTITHASTVTLRLSDDFTMDPPPYYIMCLISVVIDGIFYIAETARDHDIFFYIGTQVHVVVQYILTSHEIFDNELGIPVIDAHKKIILDRLSVTDCRAIIAHISIYTYLILYIRYIRIVYRSIGIYNIAAAPLYPRVLHLVLTTTAYYHYRTYSIRIGYIPIVYCPQSVQFVIILRFTTSLSAYIQVVPILQSVARTAPAYI